MEEQDLKNIWKGASKEEKIMINFNELMSDFKNKMGQREDIVRRRDRREIIGALVGILGFVYSFCTYANTVSRVGSVLGVLALIYIIYKLRVNRKSKGGKALFLSMKEQMIAQRTFMINQYQLLNTVVYWVSIPIFMANAFLIWGLSKSEESLTLLDQLSGKWEIKLIITLILGFFFGYIGWMNKKAARVNWKPLIQQINTLLNSQKEGGGDA